MIDRDELFVYNAGGPRVDHRMTSPPPIWSDFNPDSEMSKLAVRAKQENGPEFWNHMRKVFAHDIKTLPMERFKVWASSMIIPIVNRHRVHEQLLYALENNDFKALDLRALEEPGVGCTSEDFESTFRVLDNTNITMNRVQAYYGLGYGSSGDILDKVERLNSIVEIGAGIGDMVDVLRNIGFGGQYTIFDFPELLEIQEWYHKAIDRQKKSPIDLHRDNKYIADVENLSSADLVIATWSLTEMPLELRDRVVSKLIDTPRWLIAFSNSIFGYNNHEWVMNVLVPRLGVKPNQISLKEIRFDNIPWDKWDGGTYYLYIDKTS